MLEVNKGPGMTPFSNIDKKMRENMLYDSIKQLNKF